MEGDAARAADGRNDLELAISLADAAAAVTLPRFGDRIPVELKDDATPVTDVDRAAERAIRAVLAERAPDDGVLGEEEGHRPGANGRTWVVDPVDGTKLFAEGIPLWTTLIALTIDEIPTLGVADAPALGVRYHATRDGGAWCGTRQLVVSGVLSLVDALVAHSPIEEWYRSGDGGHLADLATAARGAWAHLLVAQGSVDALVEHEPCYAWDWSATQVIVEEAGGRITTLDGGSPTPGSNLLVSNGLVHDEVVAVLTEGST